MAGRGRGQKTGPAALLPAEITQNIPSGPPPLFPEVARPAQKLEFDDILKGLVKRQREIKRKITTSSFHLESLEDGAEKDEEFDDGFMETTRSKKKRKPPLQMVMQLTPKYFPEQLYSEKQAAQSERAAEQQQERLKRLKASAEGGQNWEQLEELEKTFESKGGGEGEEDEDLGPEDEEDEDEDQEDDDYYQNEEFDDDDGYEEMDDGNDEPIF
eukprot:TRINITY_DN5298_c2_g1_i1.p1 TRINITY_DN5298_c2_g1~~TRINITY_DN5298_c2_g1_i1.p1  ORF type:complete len:214 (+),score=68.49 TRINITY_DN5298_c2_g1_i1:83-724(+)